MNTKTDETFDEDTGEVTGGVMPAAAPPPRAFGQFLVGLENGDTHDDLSKKLQELVADLADYAAKYGVIAAGVLNLKIGFKLDEGVMHVTNKIDITKPERPRGKSIFWVTPENNLAQENPHQRKFDFQPKK